MKHVNIDLGLSEQSFDDALSVLNIELYHSVQVVAYVHPSNLCEIGRVSRNVSQLSNFSVWAVTDKKIGLNEWWLEYNGMTVGRKNERSTSQEEA